MNDEKNDDYDPIAAAFEAGFNAPKEIALAELSVLVKRWRDTADTWERQLNDDKESWSPTAMMPPQSGRGAIHNWINWLRSCANDVERCIVLARFGNKDQASSGTRGSVPSEAP